MRKKESRVKQTKSSHFHETQNRCCKISTENIQAEKTKKITSWKNIKWGKRKNDNQSLRKTPKTCPKIASQNIETIKEKQVKEERSQMPKEIKGKKK